MSFKPLPALRVNMHALFDSFAGMLPVRVLAIVPHDPALRGTKVRPEGRIRVRIRFFRKAGPYQADEELEVSSTLVVPPTAYKRPSGHQQARILRYLVKVP